MTTPLAGLKVLELARVLAGPWVGQCLADLGAHVIKVESPSGDDTRGWGDAASPDGSAAYFHSCNRGKQSIALNFREPNDIKVVLELAKEADVIIENFKVGGLAKFGLDYESLSKINPKLIYCSITGFGQTGPYAPRAGYDLIIQGMSGIMDVTGTPDGPPLKAGIAYADLLTGLYGIIGIQAALFAREKTGKGEYIDMALLDSQMGVLSNHASTFLMTGFVPERIGNAHASIVPYQVFNASDAPLVIACGNDGQFEHLCNAINREYYKDTRFIKNADRMHHREELEQLLSKDFEAYTRDEILTLMEKAGVPAGPINTIEEAFNDPQALHRNLSIKQGDFTGVRNPIQFKNYDLATPKAPPSLNQHGAQIREKLWNTEN